MTQSVLVVGHADADGHLIAEQVRRNMDSVGVFDVHVVVDPDRTKDHKVWQKLEELEEDVRSANIVLFVDMMFGPDSFVGEAKALVEFVRSYSDKRFFLVDHHPVPYRRLSRAENLRALYRPEVCECAFGPQSGLMILASLCENQKSEVKDIVRPPHDTLALGLRRAAALGGSLPGAKLLALLRADCWEGLFALGAEEGRFHYLPRGRRPSGFSESQALQNLNELAEQLLSGKATASEAHTSGNKTMAYDFDIDVGKERLIPTVGHPRALSNAPVLSRDLEGIVTLLEIAALSLTSEPGDTFTFDRLIQEARKIAGDEIELDERDARIVLQKATFIEKIGRELRLR